MSKSKVIFISYFLLIGWYIIFNKFWGKEEISIISLFYITVLGGGGSFIPFLIYLLTYDWLFQNFMRKRIFFFYWLGGIIYGTLIILLFISFDIFTMGKVSFYKEEFFLGNYRLFIYFAPIALLISWFFPSCPSVQKEE